MDTRKDTDSPRDGDWSPPVGHHSALLDVRGVAALLGNCSTRHVYRLVDAGRMPAPVRLGRLVRWRRVELEAWVEAGCPRQSRRAK